MTYDRIAPQTGGHAVTEHDPAANDLRDEGHADSERATAGGVTAPAEIRSAAAKTGTCADARSSFTS